MKCGWRTLQWRKQFYKKKRGGIIKELILKIQRETTNKFS
jgi:hypothetical protein